MTETITITGIAETSKKLRALNSKLGNKVVLGALRKGAAVVTKEVRKAAPVGSVPHFVGLKKQGIWVQPGHLRRNGFKVFRSKIYRGRRPGEAIGIFLALRKGKIAPFYGRFINDGWNSHGKHVGRSKARSAAGTKRSGRVTTAGRDIPGLNFIQKSFDANKSKVVKVIVDSAEAGIAKLAKREGL